MPAAFDRSKIQSHAADFRLLESHLLAKPTWPNIIQHHVSRDFIGLADVFVSTQANILVGSKWLSEVTAALNKAHLHVVLASPDSVKRKWINFEAALGGHLKSGHWWTDQNRPLRATETGEFYFERSSTRKSAWTLVRQLRGPHLSTCA